MFTPDSLFSYTEKVRKQNPLIHYITNQVAANFTANALNAIDATPAMVIAPENVQEFVKVSDALSINLGTLTSEQRRAIDLTTDAAHDIQRPWVLDPVGIGLKWTREFAFELLKKKPTVIRGNASEIIALAGGEFRGKGVNSTETTHDALEAGNKLRQQGSVVCITGEKDLIIGSQIIQLENGSSAMAQVSALGCALSAIVAAYIAVEKSDEERLEATIAALTHVALSGELAAKEHELPGSFAIAFLDNLKSLTLEDYKKNLRLRILE